MSNDLNSSENIGCELKGATSDRGDPFLMLRNARHRCDVLEYELAQNRSERDRLALRLVDAGYTWREVARAAGFANPYINHLKKKQAAQPRKGLVRCVEA